MSPNYQNALQTAQRINWALDDVLPSDAQFDFRRDFLPEALISSDTLPFLTPRQRRALNHIRAHGYLSTFGLVEEFILPFVLERLNNRVAAQMPEVRALLGFASEEAKHIELFRRFRAVFERGFGHRCDVLGPASAVRDHVSSHSELGVGLLILHIEWMTQSHYVDMVRDSGDLEPSFRRLLHQHWLEESQHARIDGWIVEALAEDSTEDQRRQGFDDYVALLAFLDEGLGQQVELDLEALERATTTSLTPEQRLEFVAVQRQAQRRTYLGSGVTHPRVRTAIERMLPSAAPELDELAALYA